MKRRKFSADFKSKVAIEALKERFTAQEIANKFHSKWPNGSENL